MMPGTHTNAGIVLRTLPLGHILCSWALNLGVTQFKQIKVGFTLGT